MFAEATFGSVLLAWRCVSGLVRAFCSLGMACTADQCWLQIASYPNQESKTVVGGCTCRPLRTGTNFVVVDVLVMVVAQKAEICGRGHGTRLINFVKHHFMQEAQKTPDVQGSFIVTQADIGPSAVNFWKKQRLIMNEVRCCCSCCGCLEKDRPQFARVCIASNCVEAQRTTAGCLKVCNIRRGCVTDVLFA